MFTYAPQLIVFGGGISSAFPLFQEGIQNALQDFPYKRILNQTKIVVSTLKEANLLGASSLLADWPRDVKHYTIDKYKSTYNKQEKHAM